ncbi:MAG: DNA polymerase I [Bacilli bacterium]|nr:DNA polymerase I [Bacilli bacterium]
MKKIVLVDGNNLLFRSYFATAYTGNVMKNSKGFPTNALYGFINMINKIVEEEKPEYMAVAFDIGKNFRKTKYDFYKEGRNKTPQELIDQMPVARDVLKAMGIKYFELEPYEADDIIGTISKMTEEDPDAYTLIVSSDKDLLQLVSDETEMKLLKQKDYIRYIRSSFKEEYGIEPIRIIDLKGLSGDPSDNIPGVQGVGDKTALKLLQDYESVEGIYEHIDEIKGKLQEKLLADKDNAFMSKEIATIYREVPLNTNYDEMKYVGPNASELEKIYNELEFYSLLKKIDVKPKEDNFKYEVVSSVDDIKLEDKVSIYVGYETENYYRSKAIGYGISSGDNNYFVSNEIINKIDFTNKKVYTYDYKKLLADLDISVDGDLMLIDYLVNPLHKEDFGYMILENNEKVLLLNELKKQEESVLQENIVRKSRFILDYYDKYFEKLKDEEMVSLYETIEFPLVRVLSDMEKTGVYVDTKVIDDMKEDIEARMDLITKKIYELAGKEFNINSPKQLGDVLFVDLGLPAPKSNKTGFKTDVKVLQKLYDYHPIIEHILDYRNLAKIASTYLDGLKDYIHEDGLVHTIYKQTLTRTGRLSSVEPNLQNIPVRNEEGRKVRKAFIPQNDIFLSIDYSQIELRILAHLSGDEELIKAFNNDQDIHTKVAADIFDISEDQVTKNQRRTAKAVIFGIVYGISGYGLGENLELKPSEAKKYIDKYLSLYPKVDEYMKHNISFAYENGYVKTMFNRKRIIDELKNTNFMIRQSGERMALNTPIQGTAADIMKMAMIKVYDEMKKHNFKSKIVMQVHDELIFDCFNDELDEVIKVAKEAMENIYKISVPFKVSADTGKNWYDAK